MSTTENQRKYIISSSKEFDGTILQGMGKPTIASYLRASLDPKILIRIKDAHAFRSNIHILYILIFTTNFENGYVVYN
jgi:hypothetical protein